MHPAFNLEIPFEQKIEITLLFLVKKIKPKTSIEKTGGGDPNSDGERRIVCYISVSNPKIISNHLLLSLGH